MTTYPSFSLSCSLNPSLSILFSLPLSHSLPLAHPSLFLLTLPPSLFPSPLSIPLFFHIPFLLLSPHSPSPLSFSLPIPSPSLSPTPPSNGPLSLQLGWGRCLLVWRGWSPFLQSPLCYQGSCPLDWCWKLRIQVQAFVPAVQVPVSKGAVWVLFCRCVWVVRLWKTSGT